MHFMLMLDNSVFNFANIYHTTSNRQNLKTKIMMGDCPQMIGTHSDVVIHAVKFQFLEMLHSYHIHAKKWGDAKVCTSYML